MTSNNNNDAHNNNSTAMDEGLQDLGLPVPVQTFLWRQIAPFIRPKLGKLHEASCIVSITHLIMNYSNSVHCIQNLHSLFGVLQSGLMIII